MARRLSLVVNPAAGGGPSVLSGGVDRLCENCARTDPELVLVHRVYVVPESWDTPGSSTRVEAPELWCFSCRSIYPHEVAEGGAERSEP